MYHGQLAMQSAGMCGRPWQAGRARDGQRMRERERGGSGAVCEEKGEADHLVCAGLTTAIVTGQLHQLLDAVRAVGAALAAVGMVAPANAPVNFLW